VFLQTMFAADVPLAKDSCIRMTDIGRRVVCTVTFWEELQDWFVTKKKNP